jgi:hypothetical protein
VRRGSEGTSVVLALLACVFASSTTVRAQAPTRIWAGDDAGYARQISVAIDPAHVFLSEAYAVTVIDRATGAASVVPIDLHAYLPVDDSLAADGVLWLSLGYEARGSGPRIAVFDPATSITRERARTHDVPCSLVVHAGATYWVDRSGQHVHRLGAHGGSRTVATAPRGQHFLSDCRLPLAIDDTHAYLALASSAVTAPTPLVRIALADGRWEILDPDIARRAVVIANGALVLTYAQGASASIERFDLTTHARTTIAASATVMTLATEGDTIAWIDGNYFSGADWRLMRARVSGGAPELVYAGDRRLGEGIAMDARSIVALVGAHPDGECVTHHPFEPGDIEFTRCTAPDHQLFAFAAP